MFIWINLIILLVIGILAWEDNKHREVSDLFLGLLIGICFTSFVISLNINAVTFNDTIVIFVVSVLTPILFKTGNMSEGDLGIIAIAFAMPYLTALALFYNSILIIIYEVFFKQTNLPFYGLLIVSLFFAIITVPEAIVNPHICSLIEVDQIEQTWVFSNTYCSVPFIITSYKYVNNETNKDSWNKDSSLVIFDNK